MVFEALELRLFFHPRFLSVSDGHCRSLFVSLDLILDGLLLLLLSLENLCLNFSECRLSQVLLLGSVDPLLVQLLLLALLIVFPLGVVVCDSPLYLWLHDHLLVGLSFLGVLRIELLKFSPVGCLLLVLPLDVLLLQLLHVKHILLFLMLCLDFGILPPFDVQSEIIQICLFFVCFCLDLSSRNFFGFLNHGKACLDLRLPLVLLTSFKLCDLLPIHVHQLVLAPHHLFLLHLLLTGKFLLVLLLLVELVCLSGFLSCLGLFMLLDIIQEIP